MTSPPAAARRDDGARLDRPHHDGSRLHVEVGAPTYGDDVTVWLRVPAGAGVDSVHLRTTADGEPGYREAHVDRVDPVTGETWWHASVHVRNEVNGYRWLIDGPGGNRWISQSGVHTRDVADHHDYRLVAHEPAPDWVADAVLYQIFPDRFASTGVAERVGVRDPLRLSAWDDPVVGEGMAAMHQLFGGDLPGIEAHLDHLVDLGVTGVYLNPIFPAPESHRYCASTFDEVDPLLGGDEALASLARAARARGLRLLGDLTANHTGADHPWFIAAQEARTNPEHGFYHWLDWPETYEAWAGVPSLPKLDHRSAELRRRLVDGPDSVVGRWLRDPFHLDGWRIDAANMAGRCGEVDATLDLARAIRRTALALRPDAYLLAEHCHDFTGDLDHGGWHGTMNYSGFTGSVWSWLREPQVPLFFLGVPTGVPMRSGIDAAATIDDMNGLVSWESRAASLTLLGSHDTSRLATIMPHRAIRDVAIGLLLTFPGVPSVFYGDEVGLSRGSGNPASSESSRIPMPWDEAAWDTALLAWWRQLIGLRHDHVALRRGGFRWAWVDDQTWVFLREHPEQRLLVAARRGDGPTPRLRGDVLGLVADGAEAAPLLGGEPLRASAGLVTLPDGGPRFDVWELPR